MINLCIFEFYIFTSISIRRNSRRMILRRHYHIDNFATFLLHGQHLDMAVHICALLFEKGKLSLDMHDGADFLYMNRMQPVTKSK